MGEDYSSLVREAVMAIVCVGVDIAKHVLPLMESMTLAKQLGHALVPISARQPTGCPGADCGRQIQKNRAQPRSPAENTPAALLPMPQHQSKSGFAAPFVDFELVGGAELVGWGFAFVGVEEDGVDGVAFG